MRRKSISLIIGLMTVALVGVMALQYFFIQQSYIQQSQLFDQSVMAALGHVASKAEKKEVMEYSLTVQQESRQRYQREQDLERQLRIQEEIDQIRKELFAKRQAYKEQEEHMLRVYPHAVRIDNAFYETYINNPNNRDLVSVDVGIHQAGIDGSLIRENYIEVKAVKALPMAKPKDDSVRFLLVMDINPFTNRSSNNIITLPPPTDRRLERNLEALEKEAGLYQANSLADSVAILGGKNPRLIEDFAISFALSKRPFSERVDPEFIKKELEDELESRDIRSPFYVEVRENGTLLYHFANANSIRGAEASDDPQPAVYSTPLFREDLDRSTGELRVYFPHKHQVLLSNVTVMLVSSVALLLVLVGAFAYTIFIILRQKKMSEMKTDFINNMTHEFKTPVATIMIASESLKDPDIVADRIRVARLADIIYDENVRLGNHIERVLNIAQIEKQDLRLSFADVEVNALIRAVADSMELQFQKHGAELELALDAKADVIVGDELHLSNVIFNLLDNALKYGKENPKIRLSTRNVPQGIRILVEDNGIGMSKDQLTRIFDQFYRIPTGNRHDVKGFGLGLSYVADIVKRTHGKVGVRSEKGVGTVFELIFPLKG